MIVSGGAAHVLLLYFRCFYTRLYYRTLVVAIGSYSGGEPARQRSAGGAWSVVGGVKKRAGSQTIDRVNVVWSRKMHLLIISQTKFKRSYRICTSLFNSIVVLPQNFGKVPMFWFGWSCGDGSPKIDHFNGDRWLCSAQLTTISYE